jgi:hypothetical protein
MMMKPASRLQAGDEVAATLEFANGEQAPVTFVVKKASGGGHEHPIIAAVRVDVQADREPQPPLPAPEITEHQGRDQQRRPQHTVTTQHRLRTPVARVQPRGHGTSVYSGSPRARRGSSPALSMA